MGGLSQQSPTGASTGLGSPHEGRTLPRKAVHGGLSQGELRSLGLVPEQVVDFSASINPLGPPPSVWKAMADVDLSRYPDPDCLLLREALSSALGVPSERITVGNGSTELIHLLARACLGPADGALILSPTFGEYEAACRIAGAGVTSIHAHEADGFRWDLDAVAHAIELNGPRLVFLCNPNNPTGVYLKPPDVLRLANSLIGGALLVVDEAYMPFVDGDAQSVVGLCLENLVVLRSMTKDYALTGLRLGYAVASVEVSLLLTCHQPAWSVSSVAQAAGVAALSDREHLARARECVRQGKEFLQAEMWDMGFKVCPSATNFLLVEVGDAASVRAGLLARGVCVRDCTSFGLPRHIRVGVRTLADCHRLIGELREVQNKMSAPLAGGGD